MREDWIEVELGEVCEINMGQSPPSSTYNSAKEGLPFFQGKAEFTDLYPVVRKWCTKPTRIAYEGDILLSVRAPVGSTNLANQECAIGRGLAAVSYPFSNAIIWYYLKAIEQDLDRQGTGTTFRAVSGNTIRKQKFPLAPLPIQRAIVSKIEALFSDLDNGIANFKKAQAQLKTYRQAVLKKAFEGYSKLTNVGDEFDFVGGGTPSKANSDYWNGELYWCSVKDVKGDCLHRTIDKITRKGLNESASNLVQPEEVILITRISPGKTIISKVETAINQDLKVVKPKREYLPKLIHYLFQAYQREIIKLSSGTTVLGINLTNLKSIEIPFLSSQEQVQIVQEIESRLSVCDKVEQTIKESILKAEALRQSILKKAFEGRLLSKIEIEQCKKEADYEPASELLKKIKAEKLAKEEALKKTQVKKKIITKKKSKI